MKIVDTVFKETENPNVLCVGTAMDSTVLYAALVDTKTHKCFVEEVSVTQANMGFKGVYRKIEDDKEWRRVYDFFNKSGVFDKYLKGRNYHWDKREGSLNIPSWFKDQYIGNK